MGRHRRLPGRHRPRRRRADPRAGPLAGDGLHRRRPGPREDDDLPAFGRSGAQSAHAPLPLPRHRRRAAAQSDRQSRIRGDRQPADVRAPVDLSGPSGRRHPLLQGEHRARRQGSAAASGADARGRRPLRSPLRPSGRGGRAGLPAPPGAPLRGRDRPRARRGEDEQIAGQHDRAADERRSDRQADQEGGHGLRPSHRLRSGQPARGLQPRASGGDGPGPRTGGGRRGDRGRRRRRAEEARHRVRQRHAGADPSPAG